MMTEVGGSGEVLDTNFSRIASSKTGTILLGSVSVAMQSN